MQTGVVTPEQWKKLTDTLAKWIKAEGNPDWSKAGLAALMFLLCDPAKQADIDVQQKDNSKMTCTVTMS